MDFQRKEDEANQACVEAKKAVMLYFHCLNAHRNAMFQMFHPNAQLTWNRFLFRGVEDIQKLFTALPATQHVLNIVDALPMLDSADNGKYKVILQIVGVIAFLNKNPVPFQQSFIAMSAEDHWIFCSSDFLLFHPHNVSN